MKTDIKELAATSQDLKLLYVEDEPSARKTTLNLLQNFFKFIRVAVDGEDGLKKFQEEKFDLIISDINMPNMNGIEMLRNIRKINEDIPLLFITAYNESSHFLDAIDLDVDGYILKPVVQDKLLHTLSKLVKKINLYDLQKNYTQHLEKEIIIRNEEIIQKLNFDSLTGLLSRYSFFRDIEKSKEISIVLIDIDKFKIINEVYGSSTGSIVLKKFSVYLSLAIQDYSCGLYRLSADEFAIINTDLYGNVALCEEVLEHLFKSLNNLKLEVDDNTITIDITMGLSSYEENPYEYAKIALDYAKKNKKKYIAYSPAIDHTNESSQILECRDKIDLALKESRVVPVYQVIVDKNENNVKYETLMRLREKDSEELISPFYFLDIAMKTRLYDSLSENIIFSALNKLKVTEHTLSINFTYSDIKNSELLYKIESYLSVNKSIGTRCVFEITENESIENYDDVKNFISRFRKYGIRIAIDDFGTGFSNFEYILEIEPDYLKIDGSLIKDIDTNHRSYTLVQAIVKFSHKLGIKVIAEYVHSKVIFQMLKSLDVDEYQGYYFSQPLESIEEVV